VNELMAHSFFEAAHGHVDNELVPGAELHALTSVNDDAHLFDFVRDDDLRRLQVLEVVVHLVLQALRGLFWCCRGQNSEFDV